MKTCCVDHLPMCFTIMPSLNLQSSCMELFYHCNTLVALSQVKLMDSIKNKKPKSVVSWNVVPKSSQNRLQPCAFYEFKPFFFLFIFFKLARKPLDTWSYMAWLLHQLLASEMYVFMNRRFC